MNSIGKALIYTKRNYEDELIESLGRNADMKNPEINYQQLESAFKSMSITIKSEQVTELRSFFKQSGDN
jgi:hypothetical protein